MKYDLSQAAKLSTTVSARPVMHAAQRLLHLLTKAHTENVFTPSPKHSRIRRFVAASSTEGQLHKFIGFSLKTYKTYVFKNNL